MQVFFDIQNLPPFRSAIVTIGSFDGVHEGHRSILEKVKKMADELGGDSVVVTFDPHPRQILRPDDSSFRLLTTTDEKIALLAKAGISACVVVPFSLEFGEQSPDDYLQNFLVKNFQPSAIVIGYDHHFGAKRAGNIDFLKEKAPIFGFSVVEIPKMEVDAVAVSSTKIRSAIEKGDLPTANKLLGHDFSIHGKVVEGEKIGRKIGFPTANLFVEEKAKLLPPDGIYAAWAWRGADRHAAMLYIGSRPTIDGATERRIEANLLHFSENIYGEELALEVIEKVRDDQKLDGLEALKSQIAADQIEIEKILGIEKAAPEPQKSEIRNPQSEIPKVAVVILNYSTRQHLAQFLPSVLASDCPNLEIVVADNASTDDSAAFMKRAFPNVRLIELLENHGFAGGYNEALAEVEADIFVLLNSDVEVEKNWLRPVVEAFERDPFLAIAQPKILAFAQKNAEKQRFEYAGAAGGWIDFLGYPFCRGRVFQYSEEDDGQFDDEKIHDCFWATGAAMFVRAEVFQNLGGFDADYFAHNEEIDLCWRAKRAGWRVACVTASRVWHVGGGTLEYESPRKTFLNFRNSLFSILKNEPLSKIAWLIPARLVLDGAAAAMFLAKGQRRSVAAILKAHVSFYFSIRKMWRKRADFDQKIRAFSVRKKASDGAGVFKKSIVFEHYLRRKKRFFELF